MKWALRVRDVQTTLVDAHTGQPPRDVTSVKVVADSLTWADIDATAAYAHGRDSIR